ncbi:DNA polymerase IV [Arachnia propionica]|uniref:DNA polymerase IV n=1 Tax=Arachnia propionica TaxID=1750 RepID=UPI0028D12371|nr:DNA polymerase IV [Arachnia propionica]
MRSTSSILHLDLDAFFAAVEQRDKPSLRGKPVIVGGAGPRGVVATASYEARVFGVRSAMSGTEARRRCPHAAFLGGRFGAYRQSSQVVMELLREISPLVEPLSFDEAYVDLEASRWNLAKLDEHVAGLRVELTRRTAGLTASVGVGSSKFLAKLGSEAAKPDGVRIIAPGEEIEFISPLPVRAIPGVGPVTEGKLLALGLATVADLRAADPRELVRELGRAAGESLRHLAHGRDDREVEAEREAKSISVEDTFPTDLTDWPRLASILRRDAESVAGRLQRSGSFARTVAIKVRMADFTTISKARSLGGATDHAEVIGRVGEELLAEVDIREGVRLLGIGVSNFTRAAQERLFEDETPETGRTETEVEVDTSGVRGRGFFPGADVIHDALGRGWVWGSGLGRVTVRFETRHTGPGPVRTFLEDDPALQLAKELPDLPESRLETAPRQGPVAR